MQLSFGVYLFFQTKDKFMKFLTEFKILKSSQWNEVEPLLWKEYQKEILMFKRLLRYWFNEKVSV